MQNVRRAALVGLTLVAGIALTGCRTQVGTAAFVGNDRLTESDVDAIIADANGKVSEGTHAPSRSGVVTVFVLSKTCEKAQAERKFESTSVDPASVASQLQVPADSTFAQNYARMQGCIAGLADQENKTNPNPAAPTDAEVHDIISRAQAAGIDVTFESVAPQLKADAGVRQSVEISRVFTKMVQDGNVTVSPRYRPLALTIDDLGSGVPLIVVPLGEGASDAVRSPAATASPTP
jgi:hypothetical protein